MFLKKKETSYLIYEKKNTCFSSYILCFHKDMYKKTKNEGVYRIKELETVANNCLNVHASELVGGVIN